MSVFERKAVWRTDRWNGLRTATPCPAAIVASSGTHCGFGAVVNFWLESTLFFDFAVSLLLTTHFLTIYEDARRERHEALYACNTVYALAAS